MKTRLTIAICLVMCGIGIALFNVLRPTTAVLAPNMVNHASGTLQAPQNGSKSLVLKQVVMPNDEYFYVPQPASYYNPQGNNFNVQ